MMLSHMSANAMLFPIILLAILPTLCHACPATLSSLCKCSTSPAGLSLDCSYMNFTEVAAALQRVPQDVVSFRMHHSSVMELPSNAFGDKKIKKLDLSGNALRTVGPDALDAQRPYLTSLNLANNSLVSWPNLTGFSKLLYLDVSGNFLEDVPPGTFESVPNLVHLRAAKNQICNLASQSFKEIESSLTLLDLSDNCLRSVPAQNIRGYQQLAWLDLSGNQIADLPALQFMHLPKLAEVYLDDNRIIHVAPLAFMNVPELRRLSLARNRISVLEANQFQSYQKLAILDLRDNLLSKIVPSVFRDLQGLEQLFLDNNRIDTIETVAFSDLPSLQLLSMQNNTIQEVYRNAFEQLPRLTILMLNNNSLETLEETMLAGMPNLQQLNLRDNQLPELPPGVFDRVSQLTTLDLGHNRLHRLAPNTFVDLVKLFWVDLSSNRLSTFAPGTFNRKIGNILIDGNELVCDENLEWFVTYLVSNQVRTFLPHQKEITCTAPEDMAGTRLKDMMIKKANETFFSGLKDFMDPNGITGALGGKALGSLLNLGGSPDGASLPLASFMPGLDRALPGIDQLPSSLTSVPLPAGSASLAPSITKFARPLSKLITGAPPSGLSGDINNLIRGLPDFVSQLPAASLRGVAQAQPGQAPSGIPGFPGINLQNIPPSMIQYVLKGGKIPGVPENIVQSIIQQYLAQARQSGVTLPSGAGNYESSITQTPPSLGSLPKELISHVINGGQIPGLTQKQLDDLREHYQESLTTAGIPIEKNQKSGGDAAVTLPLPGFGNDVDLSMLSPEILDALASGKTPDVRAYPELIQISQDNPALMAILEAANSKNRVRDGSSRMLFFDGDGDYNIEQLRRNANIQPPPTSPQDALWIAGIVFGVVGVLTIVTLMALCYQRRRRALALAANEKDALFHAPSPRMDSISDTPPNVAHGHLRPPMQPSAIPYAHQARSWVYDNNSASYMSTN